jgi:hypothetical protein
MTDWAGSCDSEPTSPQEKVMMALPDRKSAQASPSSQPHMAEGPALDSAISVSNALTWPGELMSGSMVSGSKK